MRTAAKPTTIGFVRHGQTDWNAVGRFQGSSDTLLNDLGRAQAAQAADYLRDQLPNIRWSAVRHSPLQRASETARIIAASIGTTDLRVLPSLAERDWGVAEGRTWDELMQLWPPLARLDPFEARQQIPGVEPRELLDARGRFVVESTTIQYPGQTVLMVTHGTLLRSSLSELLGGDIGYVPNAGVAVLEAQFTDDQLRVRLLDKSFGEDDQQTAPEGDRATQSR